jgi:hypothetical protein
MKTHPISFLSGFIAAIAVPVLVNAASLSRSLLWNPTEIAKDKGMVVLAEETAKSVRKSRMNVDLSGVESKPARDGRIKTSHFFRLNRSEVFWQGGI